MTAVLGTGAVAAAASGRTGSTFSVLWLWSVEKHFPNNINQLSSGIHIYTYTQLNKQNIFTIFSPFEKGCTSGMSASHYFLLIFEVAFSQNKSYP
jgi:hypothetical protein